MPDPLTLEDVRRLKGQMSAVPTPTQAILDQVPALCELVERLVGDLIAIEARHAEWSKGLGPCICDEHQAARETLRQIGAGEG